MIGSVGFQSVVLLIFGGLLFLFLSLINFFFGLLNYNFGNFGFLNFYFSFGYGSFVIGINYNLVNLVQISFGSFFVINIGMFGY